MKRIAFWLATGSFAALAVLGAVGVERLWPRTGANPPLADEVALGLATARDSSPVAPLPQSAGRQTTLPCRAGLGWPGLLGPMHDGSSPEIGLDLVWPEAGPYEKWRAAVGAGYSGPVAAGEAVVLLHRRDDREIVERFHAETGRSAWQVAWPTNYVGKHNYSVGPYSTPAIDGPFVYALGAQGRLCCLRLDDGSEVWRRNLYDDYRVQIEVWPAAASPLVEGDRLIVNVGGRKAKAGVVALDKTTGRTLWTATDDGASCATPRAATIHGRRHVFVWTADALVSLDPADGQVRWRIPFAANNHEAAHGASPLVAGDVVLVSGYQLGNLCVRVRPDGSYEELWRDKRELLDSQYNNLFLAGGGVCGFSTTRRTLRCLDLFTGALRWQWRSAKIRNGTTIAVDGGFLVLAESGHLASLAVDERGVAVRALTERRILAPPAMSYPALHNGLLYLRNEEELVCLDLRRAAP